MVSLKRALDAHEHLRSVISDYNEAFCAALTAVSQYAVETDATSLAQFRKHMTRLIAMARSANESTDTALDATVTPTFRGELRDYHDRAKRFIDDLRAELNQTAEALNNLLQTMQCSESPTEDRVKAELGALRAAVASDDIGYIRTRVADSVAIIAQCLEQLRREKEAVILQLKDEIRTLHASAEQARRAAAVDPSTGFYRREEYEHLIRREIVGGREIGIIHIWLRNLHSLVASYPPGIVDQALVALSKRLQSVVPPGSVLARWRSDVICAMIPMPFLKRASQEAANSIPGRYVCMDDGVARDLYVQAVVTSTCSTGRDDADAFLQKVDRLSAAV